MTSSKLAAVAEVICASSHNSSASSQPCESWGQLTWPVTSASWRLGVTQADAAEGTSSASRGRLARTPGYLGSNAPPAPTGAHFLRGRHGSLGHGARTLTPGKLLAPSHGPRARNGRASPCTARLRHGRLLCLKRACCSRRGGASSRELCACDGNFSTQKQKRRRD